MQSEALSLMGQGMQHVLQVKEERYKALQERIATSTPPSVRCERRSCVKCSFKETGLLLLHTSTLVCLVCVCCICV